MTAREKFQVGDRVRLSEDGRKYRVLRNFDREGTVVGFGRYDLKVKVRFDGWKTVKRAYAAYLEKCGTVSPSGEGV